jgi:integrase
MIVASSIPVRPPGGRRTWTVVDASYRTVGPVEEWLEAHRLARSPNTVRSYATALSQWWTYLEHRGEVDRWDGLGVPAVTSFLTWLENGREHGNAFTMIEDPPADVTVAARLAAVTSFYRWQGSVHEVVVIKRLLKGAPARTPARGMPSHLAEHRQAEASSLVKARRTQSRSRTPLLLPAEIQTILDACAVFDGETGEWRGNLRDRTLFAFLAETGMRIGEAMGLTISDFVMGRGGTPYVSVIPREGNLNDARVKMMRARRVYVSADLERLFAHYLSHLACRAAELGIVIDAEHALFVNLDRPPFLEPLKEGTVRDKVAALKKRGIGPADWTPHWFRHTHATALLLSGTADWVVSRRLGHAHVQTTLDLYGWVTEDEALKAPANWKSYSKNWDVSIDE